MGAITCKWIAFVVQPCYIMGAGSSNGQGVWLADERHWCPQPTFRQPCAAWPIPTWSWMKCMYCTSLWIQLKVLKAKRLQLSTQSLQYWLCCGLKGYCSRAVLAANRIGGSFGSREFTCDVLPLVAGDTLFIAGCGKFFEGTAEQMHKALVEILGKLPPETVHTAAQRLLCNLILKKDKTNKPKT